MCSLLPHLVKSSISGWPAFINKANSGAMPSLAISLWKDISLVCSEFINIIAKKKGLVVEILHISTLTNLVQLTTRSSGVAGHVY